MIYEIKRFLRILKWKIKRKPLYEEPKKCYLGLSLIPMDESGVVCELPKETGYNRIDSPKWTVAENGHLKNSTSVIFSEINTDYWVKFNGIFMSDSNSINGGNTLWFENFSVPINVRKHITVSFDVGSITIDVIDWDDD